MKEVTTQSAEETRTLGFKIGEKLSKNAKKRRVLALFGNLGAGKTTFIRGLVEGMGIRSRVQSPTFTYERVYENNGKKLYHFDCYRLEKPDALIDQELMEAEEKADGSMVIEWADRVKNMLPQKRTDITFSILEGDKRKITIVEFC